MYSLGLAFGLWFSVNFESLARYHVKRDFFSFVYNVQLCATIHNPCSKWNTTVPNGWATHWKLLPRERKLQAKTSKKHKEKPQAFSTEWSFPTHVKRCIHGLQVIVQFAAETVNLQCFHFSQLFLYIPPTYVHLHLCQNILLNKYCSWNGSQIDTNQNKSTQLLAKISHTTGFKFIGEIHRAQIRYWPKPKCLKAVDTIGNYSK